MFLPSLAFEWRYYLRQPSFYVTAAVFFLLPYLATVSDSVRIGGGGNVLYNGAYAIAQTLLIMGIFALFLVVNFVAGTATRNHTSRMAELIYTRPLQPVAYHLGRFFGAYAVCLLVFAMVPLGVLLGSWMPWVDQERLGPTQFSFYLTTFFYFSAPTLLFIGMVIYAVAQRLRSMLGAYMVALGLFVAYVISGTLTDEPQYRQLAALLDPFGLNTFAEISRYWTVAEKNTSVIALEGILLQNRLLWVIAGSVVLALFGGLTQMRWAQSGKPAKVSKKAISPAPSVKPLQRANSNHSAPQQSASFWVRLGFEMRQVLFSPAILILLLFSLFNLSSLFFSPFGSLYGTDDWPLTKNMVAAISDNFGLMMVIIITYYSGEIVWRERESGMGDIIDATPAANWVFWTSKLLSMWVVVALLYVVGMLFTLVFQMVSGYTEFEWSLYAMRLFYIDLLPWGLLSVLAFFIQVLSPNKFVGMLIFVAYFISSLVFSQLGLEHNMWQFASAPRVLYSDLNGYGWFLTGFNWYMLYWGLLALALSVLGYGLWQRGPELALAQRFRLLGYQLGNKGKLLLVMSLVGFVACGSFIHYNTRVLNTFVGDDESLDLQAEYERTFGAHEDDNVPIIQSVNAAVDIFPEERRIEAVAQIEVLNKGSTPIERFLVNIPEHTSAWQFDLPGIRLEEEFPRLGAAWMRLATPLQPGERLAGSMQVSRVKKGFKDRNFDLEVAENGTFINNYSLFPSVGFGSVLQDRHERRKRDLPERPRAHKLEDSSRYHESMFGKTTDFITFETTVSTSPDQIAIAPGYLQREWTENGRRYFHYKMDAPIVNFYSYLSARHEVVREQHNGVNIEVYHHPRHHWNVATMVQSVKDSLDYFNEAFGPYQHKQMRIIEFPGYRSFAQSFANTVPYSESIGFTANLTDPEDIDYVYYVTAHEVAHQWWGHQVGAANVQGSQIISESLSQYSAIMVMMNRYGQDKMRKFLKYELDRYLSGRGSEILEEMPFMRAEDQQYIHYRKGSVVMMSLWDRLGEARLNQALRSLVDNFRFKANPYPTTLDLKAALDAVATDEERRFIADLFEVIGLYDIKMASVDVADSDKGGFDITMTIAGRRLVADGQGDEQEVELNEWVDVVLFSDDPEKISADTRVLYQQKHQLKTGENTIRVHLDERPQYAGVDPFVKLIDRDSADNVLKF